MSFKEREEAFESKFKHDEDMRFRATARRDRLFGLWVAEQLGLKGDEAEHYARSVIQVNMKAAGDDDVFEKVEADLQESGVEISRHRLQKRLDECFSQAKQQLMSE